MLPGDQEYFDCNPRGPSKWKTYDATDLMSGEWKVFDLHEDVTQMKRTLPPGFSKGKGRASPDPLHRLLLNGPHVVPLDRTLILTSKSVADLNSPPIKDRDAILKAWMQDIDYEFAFFQGVWVTRAAYRHKGLNTELSLTFASTDHFHTACLLLPQWIHYLDLDLATISYIATPTTAGHLHPLSIIKATATHPGRLHYREVQRSFIHPNNEVMPDSVIVVKAVLNETAARVAYPSPAAAVRMLGTKVMIAAKAGAPYTDIRLSDPLAHYICPTNIDACKHCGSLGHLPKDCGVLVAAPTDRCATCNKAGKSDPHKDSEVCMYGNSFNQNAKAGLKRAADQALFNGILAVKHRQLFEQLFGALDVSGANTSLI
jgi:hypothetical protein